MMKLDRSRQYVLLIILLALDNSVLSSIPRRRKLSPIIWTIQNDMFKVDKNHARSDLSEFRSSQKAVVDVQIGEFLNIVCPVYDFNDDTFKNVEYHSLYMVSKQEYDDCSIKHGLPVRQILRCDKPFESIKYTFYISKFSPVPGAIEFTPGNDYYFITTSNGTLNGLNNTEGGSCRKKNMKMIIRVLASIKASKLSHYDHNQQLTGNGYLPTPRSRAYIPPSTTTTTLAPTTASTKPLKTSSKFYSLITSKALKSIQPKYSLNENLKITYVEVPYIDAATTTTPPNDIFLLEPDDYSDLISQFISTNNNSDYYYEHRTQSYLKLVPASSAFKVNVAPSLTATLFNLILISKITSFV